MSSKSSIQLKALSPLKTVILSVTGMLMDVTFAWRKDILCRTMLPATLFTLLIHLTSATASMRIEVASPMPPIKEPMGSQFMLQVVARLDMTHSQMLGKFEYTRGPIFKVVLEC